MRACDRGGPLEDVHGRRHRHAMCLAPRLRGVGSAAGTRPGCATAALASLSTGKATHLANRKAPYNGGTVPGRWLGTTHTIVTMITEHPPSSRDLVWFRSHPAFSAADLVSMPPAELLMAIDRLVAFRRVLLLLDRGLICCFVTMKLPWSVL